MSLPDSLACVPSVYAQEINKSLGGTQFTKPEYIEGASEVEGPITPSFTSAVERLDFDSLSSTDREPLLLPKPYFQHKIKTTSSGMEDGKAFTSPDLTSPNDSPASRPTLRHQPGWPSRIETSTPESCVFSYEEGELVDRPKPKDEKAPRGVNPLRMHPSVKLLKTPSGHRSAQSIIDRYPPTRPHDKVRPGLMDTPTPQPKQRSDTDELGNSPSKRAWRKFKSFIKPKSDKTTASNADEQELESGPASSPPFGSPLTATGEGMIGEERKQVRKSKSMIIGRWSKRKAESPEPELPPLPPGPYTPLTPSPLRNASGYASGYASSEVNLSSRGKDSEPREKMMRREAGRVPRYRGPRGRNDHTKMEE